MARPVHRDTVRLFRWGVVTLGTIAVIAFIGVRVQGGQELPGKGYTYISAEFGNVGTLNPRSPVTHNGVRIGEVSESTVTEDGAVVRIRLDGEVSVYRDARLAVENTSALGRKTIELDAGTPASGNLGEGVIPSTQTTDSVALDDALAAFDKQTRARLRSTLVETGAGVAGRGEDLNELLSNAPELLDDASVLTSSLAKPGTDLDGLLIEAGSLSGRFEGRTDDIESLVVDLDRTLAALNVDQTVPVTETIERAPEALDNAREAMDRLRTPLTDVETTMTRLDGGIDGLVAAEQPLRQFLRDSLVPLDRVPGVSEKAVPAVKELTEGLRDLRPVVRQLTATLDATAPFLRDLGPYATDVGGMLSMHEMLSGRLEPGKHYFSAMLVMPGLYTASLPDPTVENVPYPEPGGGAWRDNIGGSR